MNECSRTKTSVAIKDIFVNELIVLQENLQLQLKDDEISQKNIEGKIKQPIQTHFVRSNKGPFINDNNFTNILLSAFVSVDLLYFF